ncbi:MAG: hypothetical protein GX208_00875 [Firmicutes bacterium]|nr:hypothetical protein [Bacillota bacterium]
MRKALIVYGGWKGHQPDQLAALFKSILDDEGFTVEMSQTLESFNDEAALKELDLIIPIWTMGELTSEQCSAVTNAVASGVGIAGNHGGMCDAFRNNVEWQFMTGGNWVAHPGNDGVEYTVHIKKGSSPLVEGIEDFTVKSEQYYLHVDPAVEVLATTRFPIVDGPHAANGVVDMPVIWTKRWGAGKVFYCSLGHHADVMEQAECREIMRRGFLWAAKERSK